MNTCSESSVTGRPRSERAIPLIADASPLTAVVVYSAYFTVNAVGALVAAGAHAVVSKTTRPAELPDIVATAVARHA
jgi:DNA-binding NarL/FixJ family response regulator